MGNISVKLNLEALKCVKQVKKGKTGDVMCLVIPIEANNLYQGAKGTYLDLVGFELKDKKNDSKDTHLVKQSLPKDVFEKMTDEEKKSMPILGNAIVWDYQNQSQNNDVHTAEVIEEDDDLPF